MRPIKASFNIGKGKVMGLVIDDYNTCDCGAYLENGGYYCALGHPQVKKAEEKMNNSDLISGMEDLMEEERRGGMKLFVKQLHAKYGSKPEVQPAGRGRYKVSLGKYDSLELQVGDKTYIIRERSIYALPDGAITIMVSAGSYPAALQSGSSNVLVVLQTERELNYDPN